MQPTMDLAPVVVWAAGLISLISLATTIYGWLTSGSNANSKAIAEQGKRIELLERSCERLEERLARMPNQEMLHRLDVQLVKMDGELGRINERLRPVAAIAERMQELMIEQAKASR